MKPMDVMVGVDVGGTFTDFAIFKDGRLDSVKVTTSDPEAKAIVAMLSSLSLGRFTFVHGTTVATNTVLETSGAVVALVTDDGFQDLVEIGRQKRPSLYDGSIDRPPALVARGHRIGHIDVTSTTELIEALAPEAVAISLIDSYQDSSEERALAESITTALPGVTVSIGSEVSPPFREYERTETTVLNAYLAPAVSAYLVELDHTVAASKSLVMTSSGGLIPFPAAKSFVGQLTLSGPAGGVVAADALRRRHGLGSVITFDMGGTSTDVARIGPGGIKVASDQVIGGRVNRVPSIPIHTVGAGGGSVAWVDPGGALRVGPRSAGAVPGPVAYGLGGAEPTVTDANLVLGHIPDAGLFPDELRLDRALAYKALEDLGKVVGLGPERVAEGILEIVDSHMEGAIKKVSIESGFDPAESALIAYGGAGGLHATRLARRLGMRSVLVPPHTGIFSALGLLMAKPRVEIEQTALGPVDVLDPAPVADLLDRVDARYRDVFGDRPDEMAVFVDARYRSQSHELTIPYREGGVGEDFEAEHEKRFGFRLEGVAVEVVNWRGVATGQPDLDWSSFQPIHSSRPDSPSPLVVAGSRRDVWERSALPPGSMISGPALIADSTASVLVGEDENTTVWDDGTLEITW